MPGTLATTIVMVDDNLDEMFLTRRRLDHDGVVGTFVEQNRPEQLLDTLASLAGSGSDMSRLVILLDIDMPRLGGFEVLQEIRARDAYRLASVIMLSASGSESDKSRARELGANGYIVKPISSSGVQAVLDSVNGDTPDRLFPAIIPCAQ